MAHVKRHNALPQVPASFFSMILGLAGLGNAWRAAHDTWGLPAVVGEAILGLATVIWVILLLLYLGKWLWARQSAIDELHHPIDCSFVGLIGVATLLIAMAAVPYDRLAAWILFDAGASFSLIYAVWQTGALWKNDRDHSSTTAVLYLPTVAGSFVTGTAAAMLGYPDWGQLAFGAGMFSWLAIESVLLHRLYTVDRMPMAQRPSLGIQFAPPAVGAVTYVTATTGMPDAFASALVGYALLQALVVLRLFPWIRQQPFAPSYWAFTFGAASLAIAMIRMIARGSHGAIALLAPYVFVIANLIVGSVFLATVHLAIRRKLFTRSEGT